MQKKTLKVYWAGDLFDAKDLCGNMLLAAAVEKVSQNRYRIMLPQNGESEVVNRTSQSIRDADFELLFNCDCIVANFDGTDLDSGTVVEFCFAKMVDMPAVLLRTDFRHSGDHELADGDPWNLMCSHYPRTRSVHLNAMVLYHDLQLNNSNNLTIMQEYLDRIAQEIVAALDNVTACKSWLKTSELASQYERAVKSIGGSLVERFDNMMGKKLIEEKIFSGLFD